MSKPASSTTLLDSSTTNYGSIRAADPTDIDESSAHAPRHTGLQRGLSARQVQMIAIAGTIGTGLFLGTGRSLAQGGPASMLICYSIVGFIVYVTLLLLGEMATQYPVAGSFNAYTTRFFSPSYGFALAWNYWFNDAVSVASDLTAAQIVLQFWDVENAWIISLVFWVFLVGVNSLHVGGYGELEYWLSSLKVFTVVLFIILGTLVNLGINTEHTFIGLTNWKIPGAPFVGGFGGFARVFVTASFAFGGTESLGITAGETKNPSNNMPRVDYDLLHLHHLIHWTQWSTTTSPFTIVFKQAGSTAAASFMNSVILTSVLSAGNHALFAGTRVLYGLSVTNPPQAPKVFAWTTSAGTPIPALLMTSSVSALCFGTSFIGTGELWGWLQNIVGVSNQIAWLSIGLSSWRFRRAWIKQGRSLTELKYRASWTWPWGPPFVVFAVFTLILIQGWSSVIPRFSPSDFISFYIEIPVMAIMLLGWILLRNTATPVPSGSSTESLLSEPCTHAAPTKKTTRYLDLVDAGTVDLYRDEYHEEGQEDEASEDETATRLSGKKKLFWSLYYWLI
ncbi:hypothetical protein NLJ89_g6360 [Agrocybe chaxingu]|uniref:Amino acid permease/ SLC12A domain-containing protein n=1 Tax=Agrocybe chaxingu TaxID=84603 RepID=A0A9W8JZF1_9AGAR|nr:hypothetical protein NLJ89_g6360 [Agrocybe chaxingu]